MWYSHLFIELSMVKIRDRICRSVRFVRFESQAMSRVSMCPCCLKRFAGYSWIFVLESLELD